MPDITKDADAQASASANAAPVAAAVTPPPPTPPAEPMVPLSAVVKTVGEPNGLPPAAPEVQLQPPTEVIKLREWFHEHIKNSVHSGDTPHYNTLFQLVESLVAKIHSKYPLAKES